jgi:hypothetical protein
VLSLIAFASAEPAASAWVLCKHSYEVWVEGNKVEHRREVAWKKVAKPPADSVLSNAVQRPVRPASSAVCQQAGSRS